MSKVVEYSEYAPFESRANELIKKHGLLCRSSLKIDGVLMITLYRPATEIEMTFDFPFDKDSEMFWEEVVNRLEIGDAIDEFN